MPLALTQEWLALFCMLRYEGRRLGPGNMAGILANGAHGAAWIDNTPSGVQVHRCSATERVATVRRQGLLCTDQFRILVDLAAVAATPTLLESRLLRLLARRGVTVMGTEVAVLEGLYRIDVMVTPWFALEVDGYLYHWSSEHKRADERRRNEIRMNGVVLLIYCWRDVADDGERILAEVRAVLTSGPRSVSSFVKGQATGS